MSNPLSLHVTGPEGRRDGLGAWMDQLYRAGCPVNVLYCLNENAKFNINDFSPGTRWIYRLQNDTFARQPDGFFTGDPRASARAWLIETRDHENRTQLDHWALNPADWFDPLNEPAPGTVEQTIWLNEWMLEALSIATERGYRLALFSFPTGSPDYPLWSYLIPALQLGKLNDAVLSLHAYNDGGLAERDGNGNLTPAALHNAFRHRQINALLPQSAQLPIVYTEASQGNGYGSIPAQAWIKDLIDYGQIIKNEPEVLSACAFQLGGGELNCWQALPDLGDAIVAEEWAVAPPATNWRFEHYHIDGGAAITDNPITIVMDRAHTVIVNAVQMDATHFLLTVTIDPPEARIEVILTPPQPIGGYVVGQPVEIFTRAIP